MVERIPKEVVGFEADCERFGDRPQVGMEL
jgi:hypothetical protein